MDERNSVFQRCQRILDGGRTKASNYLAHPRSRRSRGGRSVRPKRGRDARTSTGISMNVAIGHGALKREAGPNDQTLYRYVIEQTTLITQDITSSLQHPKVFPMENSSTERWREIAELASKEQDPTKLTELIRELDSALDQKTSTLDPPPHKPSE